MSIGSEWLKETCDRQYRVLLMYPGGGRKGSGLLYNNIYSKIAD